MGEHLTMWLVGLGLVTMVLFPLALPIIALTVVAVLPLLLIPLAGALVVAPLILLWKLGRWMFRSRDRRPPVTDGPAISSPS